MKEKFHEFRQETGRWSNRAISPLDFNSRSDTAKDIVLLHPGWYKRPEMLRLIMDGIAEHGMMPIGLDTRSGYANEQRKGSSLLGQRYRVGSDNPYFTHATAHENRYRLSRPTGVLSLVEELEHEFNFSIPSASLVGHSEGGRIMTEVAMSRCLHVPKLVVVNSVGVGNVLSLGSLIRSNGSGNELFRGESFGLLREAMPSTFKSIYYTVTRPRRWQRERDVILAEDLWPKLDEIALAERTQVSALHAKNDMALGFEHASRMAEGREHITFIPTEGGHSNIYTPAVAEQIVEQLVG